nr:hypothetical protein [Porphyromonas endodontalis]
MIVLKFGGTSVGSAQRIRAVAHLVSTIAGRKIVILSAMSGTTDTLVQLAQQIINAQWQEAEETVATLGMASLSSHFRRIAEPNAQRGFYSKRRKAYPISGRNHQYNPNGIYATRV